MKASGSSVFQRLSDGKEWVRPFQVPALGWTASLTFCIAGIVKGDRLPAPGKGKAVPRRSHSSFQAPRLRQVAAAVF